MEAPALLLLIATLLPLASFVVLMFFGRRMGSPFAGFFGTAAIAGSFACSVAATIFWLGGDRAGKSPILMPIPWIPVGPGVNQNTPGFLDLGIYVDSLTVLMFFMITLVAALVHLFSIGYMAEDKRYPRFFTYLALFCFSMLGLVIGGTIMQLFVFWELVGLCSYLLIGFWYEKKSASNAAIKAFVTNRVGDFGFLIGFGILFYHLGNATLPDVWRLLGDAGLGVDNISLPDGGQFFGPLLTVMGIGLFFGAVGKSAQFPLHVWLPDAMEGPTPVSALIHAATMVAAGVYLVGRIFPILTPDAKLFIAITGCVTLTMAALIAVVQTDIKKVLAYSTLSQLGYMILAMGVGSWMGGLFHLITHAFFKALLFLGSGSVIHAAHHEQELPQYGGLLKKIPVTGITFLIAVFAIAGTGFGPIGFSGFFSKDTIIADAGAFAALATSQPGASKLYWLLWLMPVLMAYVTAFYMMRCFTLTFLGKPRNQHLHDHAHESPIMWLPLVILAVLSVGGGYIGIQTMLRNSIRETEAIAGAKVFQTAWQGRLPGEFGFAGAGESAAPAAAHAGPLASGMPMSAHEAHVSGHSLVVWVMPAFIIGIGLGCAMYLNGYRMASRLLRIPPLGWIHSWLYHRMYFDELYYWVFVQSVMSAARVSAAFDRYVVDGAVNGVAWLTRQASVGAGMYDRYVVDGAVNGVGSLAHSLGAAARTPQTGRIRVYVTVLMVAVALGLAGAIIIVLS